MEVPAPPRARRGRPSSLTHEQIVDAAVRLVGERGMEDVSMREIATELNVPLTTLYNYIASKEALSVLVVDHILRPVGIPGVEAGTWQQRIRVLESDARRALANYPGVSIRSAVRSAEAMRLADGVLSILTSSGFAPHDATRAFAVLYTFMRGQIEVDSFGASKTEPVEPTFENVTGGGPTLDELFEFGFDVLLTGLEAVLRPKRSGRASNTSPTSGSVSSRPPDPITRSAL